ncbi:MAG: hypothetical protein ACXWNK_17200 [Vulcanimicrobiaceae bacterium]
MLDLWQVASELTERLIRIFAEDEFGRRPVFGGTELFQTDAHWRNYVPFHARGVSRAIEGLARRCQQPI